MCPGDVVSADASLDVRVGGSYRIVMKGKDGDHVRTGVYQVVEPPSKLVFTWTREEDEVVMLVTVEFLDHGSESELVLTHERLPDVLYHAISGGHCTTGSTATGSCHASSRTSHRHRESRHAQSWAQAPGSIAAVKSEWPSGLDELC